MWLSIIIVQSFLYNVRNLRASEYFTYHKGYYWFLIIKTPLWAYAAPELYAVCYAKKKYVTSKPAVFWRFEMKIQSACPRSLQKYRITANLISSNTLNAKSIINFGAIYGEKIKYNTTTLSISPTDLSQKTHMKTLQHTYYLFNWVLASGLIAMWKLPLKRVLNLSGCYIDCESANIREGKFFLSGSIDWLIVYTKRPAKKTCLKNNKYTRSK